MNHRRTHLKCGIFLCLLSQFSFVLSLHPQDLKAQTPSAAPTRSVQVAPGEVPAAMPPGAPGRPMPTPPGQPTKDGPPGKDGATPPGSGNKPAAPTTISRPTEPPEKPNPSEFNVKPNQDGMVEFQFRNQPWPELLRWLATVSNCTLDWQELPADYVNIATQKPYTLAETQDLVNRHLLSRGFTMLDNDGALSVVKVASLNPAMVPRVNPEQLNDHPPHRFLRTSFKLSFLVAQDVLEEFKSMLSTNGKMTPLPATNRLEVMDAAGNLLDIYRLLNQEESAEALDGLAREFPLKHARASLVKLQLDEFLGISKPAAPSNVSPDQMARMQQMQMQQMQMQQQQQGGAPKPAAPKTAEVHIIANDRNNSVIVHAPPNKMAVIAAFISRVDVRNGNSDFQRLQGKMRTFRLASLDPKQLVDSLTQMDVLEPATRLQVDEKNNAIIAFASIADQFVIQSIVERLDGSGRSFEVIQLRRLDAESVAGSIQFLMGAQEEKKDESSRYSYYSYWDSFNSSNKKKTDDKMRVAANVQDNQVLLWANPVEMDEVQKLLVKLGEIPPEGGRASTIRIIDASKQPETLEYLKQLKEHWERLSPNPLSIPNADEFDLEDAVTPAPAETTGNTEKGKVTSVPTSESNLSNATSLSQHSGQQLPVRDHRFTSAPAQFKEGPASAGHADAKSTAKSTAAEDSVADNPSSQQLPSTSPPSQKSRLAKDASAEASAIRIMFDENGNLVLQSDDTAALDRLEELMQTRRPPRRQYDVFRVKHLTATWISFDLEKYFKDRAEKKDNSNDRFYSWYFGFPSSSNNKSEARQLGKRPPITFIANNDSNTIIVQNADDADRQTIKDLIELWDVPEPANTKNIRVTALVRIQHSRAESIVEAIKDVYRDLLSTNDKAFQQQNARPNSDGSRGDSGYRRGYSDAEVVSPSGGLNFTFKGKLSLGVESTTNSVLISADGEALLDLVRRLIEELDMAAKTEGHTVIQNLGTNVNASSLQKALRSMIEAKNQQNQAQQRQNQPRQPGMNPQNGQNGLPGSPVVNEANQ